MRLEYHLYDVFSARPFGGNQLAVVMNAEELSAQGMQRIAREFNFAETTFVLPPITRGSTRRVRIFTPGAELDFAGHPTIGTACALLRRKQVREAVHESIILDEGVGPVGVDVEQDGSGISAMLTLARPLDAPPEAVERSQIGAVLSVDEGSVVETFFAGVGLRFCFAHLASPDDVDRAVIDPVAWRKYLASAWSPNVFLFAGELLNGTTLYARMFAPALGVPEDPATGSACAALVGVASERSRGSSVGFSVTQGVAMGRPSTIAAAAHRENGHLRSVSVGGPACYIGSGVLEIPGSLLTGSVDPCCELDRG